MFFTKQVKCETCKHRIDKKDAQKVVFEGDYLIKTKFYCPMHQKQFDFVLISNKRWQFFKTIPAHEIEVDENGKEIKRK